MSDIPTPRGGVQRDWWTEYQLFRRQFKKLEKAARQVLKEVDDNLGHKEPPFKYGAPFGALAELRQALPKTYEEFKANKTASNCSDTLRAQGKAYPRTCAVCGLGPCLHPRPTEPAEQGEA